MSDLQVDLDTSPADTLRLLATLSESWGAEWQGDAWGGRLTLPVRAGLRRGVVEGRVVVEQRGAGSKVRIEIEQQHWAVHWQAAVILAFGAFGGLIAIAWPFYPQLLALAPLGILLSFAAWFLVASRLRSSGPEEYLAAAVEAAAGPG